MSRIFRLLVATLALALVAACSGPQESRDAGTPTTVIPAAPTVTPSSAPTHTRVPETATTAPIALATVPPALTPTTLPASSPTVTIIPSPTPSPLPPTPAATPTTSRAPVERPADQQLDLPNLDTHYQLTISELRVSGGYVRVSERVTIREFRSTAPQRLFFQVVPAQLGFFELHSMAVAGISVEPDRLNDGFTLAVDWPEGATAPLEITFEFTLWVGVDPTGWAGTALDNGILRLGNWFPVISTDHGFSHIFDPSYTSTAEFDVSVTLDPSLSVAHTGDLVERVLQADGRATLQLRAVDVRDFALVVSPAFVLDEAVTSTDVRVALYTTASGIGTRQDILGWAVDAIEQLTDLIGPYPYSTLTIVDAGPSMPGGLEFPMLIYINPAYDDLERLVYHEVAHQWLYGIIGTRPLAEGWIDEGGAEFFERGLPTGFQDVPAIPEGGYLYPVDASYLELQGAGWTDAYFAIYEQGARLFYAVLEAMGWEQFWAAMRTLYETHRFGFVTAWDVLLNWQQHSATDLRELFAGYFRYDWIDRLLAPGTR